MPERKMPWPHCPTHQLSEEGVYFVTGATYGKQLFFSGTKRLRVLQRGLLTVTQQFGWRLEAWAVFANHYHFVAHSPSGGAGSLSEMLGILHGKTALWINKLDIQPGRKVWFNFWETRLTHQRSYLTRLNYVHQNAVKHGLVPLACQYPWCSAGWFERTASAAIVKSIYRFKIDRVAFGDEYNLDGDW